MEEWKAKGQEEGQHELDKRLAIPQQPKGGGCILEVNGDGAVLRLGLVAVPTCHPSVLRCRKLMRYDGGNTVQSQDSCTELRALPLHRVECGNKRYV